MSATIRDDRSYKIDPHGVGGWRIVREVAGYVDMRHDTLLFDCPGHRLHGQPAQIICARSHLILADASHTSASAAGGETEADYQAQRSAPAAESAPTDATHRESVVRPASAFPSVGATNRSGGSDKAAAPSLTPHGTPAVPGHRGARNTDPLTSLEAAESVDDHTRRNAYTTILRALYEHGPQTDWQLGQRMGLLATSAGKRRGELRDMGLVERTDHRGPTETGAKKAYRWALTEYGEREVAA